MSKAVAPVRPWAARGAALLAFVAAGTAIGAWAGSIPVLKQSLGLSDSAISVAMLSFAVGAMLAMPPTGWLTTRLAGERVMAGAGIACAATLLLPAIAPSLPFLAAASLCLGASKGALDVSMNAYATSVQRDWGAPIMSSFHAAFSIGGMVGSAGMGFALGGGFGLRGSLAAGSAGIAVLTLAALVLARRAPLAPDASAGRSGFVWPSRALLGLGGLAFLLMLIEGALADWSGVFLLTTAGASAATATNGYAGFALAMAAGRLVGDRIVLAGGALRVLRLGALLAGLGMAIALAVATPSVTIAGFVLVGLGVANAIPLLFTAAARMPGISPGMGVASAATLGYSGFLLGPPAIGFVADASGLRLALGLLVVAAVVVAAGAGRSIGARFADVRRR